MNIKPCPFCGGISPRKITLRQDGTLHNSNVLYATFGCDKCDAYVVGTGTTSQEAWNDAMKHWNNRV